MKKKRLYFDGTPLTNKYVSGVGKVLLETLRALDTDAYTHKYELCLFAPLGEAKLLQKYHFTHVIVKTLPYPHKFLSLFSRLPLSPPLDLFLGKGIYIFSNFRNWSLLFSRSVTYIHDVSFKKYPEFVQAENLAYLNKYIKVWLKRADIIVTVSEAAKQEIEEELNLKNVKVVPNAVSGQEFYPRSEKEISTVSKKWSLPNNYHVFIGNIEPRKNLINLVLGFRRYAELSQKDECLVIIGGSGWKNEEIFHEIELAQKGKVTILHPEEYVPDEDIPAIISGAVTLIQPSWHEGFGLPVLQALACGIPVVASDIPVLHETVGKNTDRVVFADPSSIESIAQAVKRASVKKRLTSPKDIATWSQSVKALEKIVDAL